MENGIHLLSLLVLLVSRFAVFVGFLLSRFGFPFQAPSLPLRLSIELRVRPRHHRSLSTLAGPFIEPRILALTPVSGGGRRPSVHFLSLCRSCRRAKLLWAQRTQTSASPASLFPSPPNPHWLARAAESGGVCTCTSARMNPKDDQRAVQKISRKFSSQRSNAVYKTPGRSPIERGVTRSRRKEGGRRDRHDRARRGRPGAKKKLEGEDGEVPSQSVIGR